MTKFIKSDKSVKNNLLIKSLELISVYFKLKTVPVDCCWPVASLHRGTAHEFLPKTICWDCIYYSQTFENSDWNCFDNICDCLYFAGRSRCRISVSTGRSCSSRTGSSAYRAGTSSSARSSKTPTKRGGRR